MDGVVWLLILLFGGYIASRYYSVTVEVDRKSQNKVIAPAGINYYSSTPVTQRPQQLWAFEQVNPCSTVPADTSAAFGPNENQPQPVLKLEI